ncbi:hypothetical protein ACVIIW_003669 [Bradyrhizobium sp. USDA 4449]
MASARQIEANRRNCRRSTGPKTAVGKAKSSQNAVRHGLARGDGNDSAAIENLAVAIALGLGHQIAPELAISFVRAKLARLHIRSLRQDVLVALLTGPSLAAVKRLKSLERYERAALVIQKRTLRALSLA